MGVSAEDTATLACSLTRHEACEEEVACALCAVVTLQSKQKGSRTKTLCKLHRQRICLVWICYGDMTSENAR
jgi:hypothetical protein